MAKAGAAAEAAKEQQGALRGALEEQRAQAAALEAEQRALREELQQQEAEVAALREQLQAAQAAVSARGCLGGSGGSCVFEGLSRACLCRYACATAAC